MTQTSNLPLETLEKRFFSSADNLLKHLHDGLAIVVAEAEKLPEQASVVLATHSGAALAPEDLKDIPGEPGVNTGVYLLKKQVVAEILVRLGADAVIEILNKGHCESRLTGVVCVGDTLSTFCPACVLKKFSAQDSKSL